jgi:hypothetical protein
LVNINSTIEADAVDLLLRVFSDIFLANERVFLPEAPEVHVELAGYNNARNNIEARVVDGDLDLGQSDNIVDCVEACDWIFGHKVGNVNEHLG